MEQRYVLWIIMLAATLFKALANGYEYRHIMEKDEDKQKVYGIVYHVFDLFSIGIPLMAFTLSEYTMADVPLVVLGFALIYLGIFDILYNKVTGRNEQYVGETDGIDILWNKFIQDKPFRKTLVLGARVLSFIVGTSIILDFI